MYIIREARAEDAEAIAVVHVQSWRDAYTGLVPQAVLDGLSVERRADAWREWLPKLEQSRTWVAEVEGEIAGFVNAGASRDGDAPAGTGEINAIYVLGSLWDAGLGAALMNTALEWLRERFAAATLWVLEGNHRGRRFYEKGGWRPDGKSQDLDFEGTSLPEMRYRIDL